MKIGILTYHFVYNFGANLQVYSTFNYLKKQGYSPLVINYIPEDLEEGYTKSNHPEQILAHKTFISENLECSEICRSEKDIAKTIEKNDIKSVIVGSDAVLKLKPFLSRFY